MHRPAFASAPPRPAPTVPPSPSVRADRRLPAVPRGTTRTLPPDDREPELRPALRELHLGKLRVDLAADRLDRFDLPAVGEGVVKFPPRDAPRPTVSGLLVAEARQERPAARLDHPGQPLDVAPPVGVGEDVEQAPVERGGKPLAPAGQFPRVLDQELDRQAPLDRLASGPL